MAPSARKGSAKQSQLGAQGAAAQGRRSPGRRFGSALTWLALTAAVAAVAGAVFPQQRAAVAAFAAARATDLADAILGRAGRQSPRGGPVVLGPHRLGANGSWGYRYPCGKHRASYSAASPPPTCGRLVDDALLGSQPELLSQLRSLGTGGIALGRQAGPAGLVDMQSGALSYGDDFISLFAVIRQRLEKGRGLPEGFSPENLLAYRGWVRTLAEHVQSEFGADPARPYYLANPSFFSRMLGSKRPRSVHDEYWHPHVDTSQYEGFVVTTLTYLSTQGEDFDGGEFVFIKAERGPHDEPEGVGLNGGEGETGTADTVVSPRAGRVVAFSSGADSVHRVRPVTSGARWAITTAFTTLPPPNGIPIDEVFAEAIALASGDAAPKDAAP